MVINYSLCLNLFVLFEKSIFLKEHHLLSCLPYKNVLHKFTKLSLNKFISFFFFLRIIFKKATKKVPQLD